MYMPSSGNRYEENNPKGFKNYMQDIYYNFPTHFLKLVVLCCQNQTEVSQDKKTIDQPTLWTQPQILNQILANQI